MPTRRKTSGAKKTARSRGASRAATGEKAAELFDEYAERGNAAWKAVIGELRRLVKRALPDSSETINTWGIPTFEYYGPICYVMAGKNHVMFGFTRGSSLSDPGGLLEGTGKNLRHVKLNDLKRLRDENLRRLIVEAAALNQKTPLTSSMRVK